MALLFVIGCIFGYILGLNAPWWIAILYVILTQVYIRSKFVKQKEIGALVDITLIGFSYFGALIGIIVHLCYHPTNMKPITDLLKMVFLP